MTMRTSLGFATGLLMLLAALPAAALERDYSRDARIVGRASHPDSQYFSLRTTGELLIANRGSRSLDFFDLAQPAAPVLASSWPTAAKAAWPPDGFLWDVAVFGPRVIVLTEEDERSVVTTLDVSDPQTPTVVAVRSFIPPRLTRLAANADRLVACGYDSLVVLEITPADTLVAVGGLRLGGYAELTLDGTMLYAGLQDGTILVIDLADPTTPVRIATAEAPGPIAALIVRGDVLYVSCDHDQLVMFDVAHPTHPTLQDWVDLHLVPYHYELMDAHLAGITDWEDFQLYSLADPYRPDLTASIKLPLGIYGSAAVAGYAYLSTVVDGIVVVDLADHRTQMPLGTVDIRNLRIRHLTARGDIAVTAFHDHDTDASRLAIYDLADLSHPGMTGWSADVEDVQGLQVGDGVVHVADGSGGYRVFTVTDTDPAPTAHLEFDAPVLAVAADAGLAVLGLGDRLVVLDVATPSAPVLQAEIPSPGGHRFLRLDGRQLAFADATDLHIYDLTSADAPASVGTVPVPGTPTDLVVDGPIVLSLQGATLRTHRRDGGTLLPLAELDLELWGRRVTQLSLDGDVAYLHGEAESIIIVDRSDPEAPTLRGTISRYDGHYQVAIASHGIVAGGYDPTQQQGLLVTYPLHADATVSLEEPLPPVTLPTAGPRILAAAPNPFNPAVRIAYAVGRPGPVRVTVHDLSGRCVATLVDRTLEVGEHACSWQGRDDAGRAAASGGYMLRIRTPDGADHRKLTLVR